MARNEKEYAEVQSLRRALIVRDVSDAEYDKAKARLDNYKFNYDTPESIRINVHTKRLIDIFEAPTVNAEKSKAAKRDKALNFFKNFFLIIAAIAVLILGAWLIKLFPPKASAREA